MNPPTIPTPFPMLFAGLWIWLDATRITGFDDGDDLTTWVDVSGNGHHATNFPLPHAQPIYQAQGLGANDLPNVANSTSSAMRFQGLTHAASGYTIYAALSMVLEDLPSQQRLFHSNLGPSPWGLLMDRFDAGLGDDYTGAFTNLAVHSAHVATSGLQVLSWRFEPSGLRRMRVTKHQPPTIDRLTVNSAGLAVPSGGMVVGNEPGLFSDSGGATNILWCDAGEIIFYDQLHSEDDEAQLVDYLIEKWGL